jgi:hypothetical protein
LCDSPIQAHYADNIDHFLRPAAYDSRKKPPGSFSDTDGNKPGVRSYVCYLYNTLAGTIAVYDS